MNFEAVLIVFLICLVLIRLFVLYKQMKLYRKMNQHIKETESSLGRLDKDMRVLKDRIINLVNTYCGVGGVKDKERNNF